jgi:hypothetical protein
MGSPLRLGFLPHEATLADHPELAVDGRPAPGVAQGVRATKWQSLYAAISNATSVIDGRICMVILREYHRANAQPDCARDPRSTVT